MLGEHPLIEICHILLHMSKKEDSNYHFKQDMNYKICEV